MKITLSPSQARTLKSAPNDWEALPDHLCTSALRLMALIAIRDEPGERGLHRGFQWRITPFGARVIHSRVVDEQIPACCSTANQFSVDLARCGFIGVSGLGDAKIAHPELAPWANAETPDTFTETNSVTYARGRQ